MDRYQILGVMGRGGFGCVYRARSQFMGREVAIKVLDRQGKLTDEVKARGQREAVILGQLEHTNIVRVHEAEVSPSGHLYIVMELLEGMTLAERLRVKGPFGVREGLQILEALCSALECAHKIKAVHRDLKPANIFITNEGAPKILDFGIAKIAGNVGWQTAPNMVVGTSLYVSPEQIRGQAATHLSDIYSLGLVAFQLFHGTHPLVLQEPGADLRDAQMVWHLQIKSRAPRLDHVIPGFPEHVARLVNTALAKDPGQRFQSAAEMGEKSRVARLRLDAEPGVAGTGPSSSRRRPTPVVRRHESDGPRGSVPPERAPESTSPQRAQTAQIAAKCTKMLFDSEPSQARDALPLPPWSVAGSVAPGVNLPPSLPSFSVEESSAAAGSSSHLLPPSNLDTTGARQNVSHTLTMPAQPVPWTASRPWIVGGVVASVGCALGVSLLVLNDPWAAAAPALQPGEVVIEPLPQTQTLASSPSPAVAVPQKDASAVRVNEIAEVSPVAGPSPSEVTAHPSASSASVRTSGLIASKVKPMTVSGASSQANSTTKTQEKTRPKKTSSASAPALPDSGLW